ncbi:MAG TPA: hypothetical protein VF193_18090 [Steroidobacter sp.]
MRPIIPSSRGEPCAVAGRCASAPLFCTLLLLSSASLASSVEMDEHAELFLPDLVSTPDAEVRVTFSPDGRRVLWGRIGGQDDPDGWQIFESVHGSRGWSVPEPVPFNSSANDFDPSFAPDGSGVYFFSNRPGGFGRDDLYFVPFDPKTGRYGTARNLGPEINTPGNEWAPVVSPDGRRLMFASDGHGGKGKQDLFIASREGEAWVKPENLAALNTPGDDFDAAFLHDGESIVYTSGDVNGTVALYLARFEKGKWLARERLGPSVNSTLPEVWTFGPSISPHDPNALYFTSRHAVNRGRADIYRIEYRLTP